MVRSDWRSRTETTGEEWMDLVRRTVMMIPIAMARFLDGQLWLARIMGKDSER